MPKNKSQKGPSLPEKLCPACDHMFSWRKKWERNWNEIVYCSDRCRNKRTAKSDTPS